MPSAPLLDRGGELLDHLEVDVGLEQREAEISRIAALMSSLGQARRADARPAQRAPGSFSERESNICSIKSTVCARAWRLDLLVIGSGAPAASGAAIQAAKLGKRVAGGRSGANRLGGVVDPHRQRSPSKDRCARPVLEQLAQAAPPRTCSTPTRRWTRSTARRLRRALMDRAGPAVVAAEDRRGGSGSSSRRKPCRAACPARRCSRIPTPCASADQATRPIRRAAHRHRRGHDGPPRPGLGRLRRPAGDRLRRPAQGSSNRVPRTMTVVGAGGDRGSSTRRCFGALGDQGDRGRTRREGAWLSFLDGEISARRSSNLLRRPQRHVPGLREEGLAAGSTTSAAGSPRRCAWESGQGDRLRGPCSTRVRAPRATRRGWAWPQRGWEGRKPRGGAPEGSTARNRTAVPPHLRRGRRGPAGRPGRDGRWSRGRIAALARVRRGR